MISCKIFHFLILLVIDLLNLTGLIGIYILLNNKDVPFSPIMIVITDFILSMCRFLVLIFMLNINNTSCLNLMYFQYIALFFNSILRIGIIICVLIQTEIDVLLQITYYALLPTSLIQFIILTCVYFSLKVKTKDSFIELV